MSIHVLKFSCGGKRLINSIDFIGKEIILWLSGIKLHKGFNKSIKYLNWYGENIYFKKIMPVLETMAEIGMPLLIHGEVTDKEIDIFDREKVFIDQKLDFICKELPELKITLEHITTKDDNYNNTISYLKL